MLHLVEQVHLLVVTAKDGAADPRLSTATVTVLVSDMGDEPPVFSQQVYEATVPENVPDALLTTVVATDPDTRPSVRFDFCSYLAAQFYVAFLLSSVVWFIIRYDKCKIVCINTSLSIS